MLDTENLIEYQEMIEVLGVSCQSGSWKSHGTGANVTARSNSHTNKVSCLNNEIVLGGDGDCGKAKKADNRQDGNGWYITCYGAGFKRVTAICAKF